MKKFTIGDQKTTVLDYFCPQCSLAESINCDEPEWRKAVARWRDAGESTKSQ